MGAGPEVGTAPGLGNAIISVVLVPPLTRTRYNLINAVNDFSGGQSLHGGPFPFFQRCLKGRDQPDKPAFG